MLNVLWDAATRALMLNVLWDAASRRGRAPPPFTPRHRLCTLARVPNSWRLAGLHTLGDARIVGGGEGGSAPSPRSGVPKQLRTESGACAVLYTMRTKDFSVADLARRCREETQRFLRGEPRDDSYCFELFHRAVAQREHDAWEAIMAQYRGIVLAYVGQHSAAALVREADDFWVNRAFQRFWMAVGPERFNQFSDLPGLLKYLKLCVHSVLLDEVRARKLSTTGSLSELPEEAAAPGDAEESVLGELSGQQLWRVISRELQSEAEQVVALLSFARDLKPAEIFDRHPALYGSVADVYRIKRNIVERLRRSPEVRAFLA